MRLFISDEINVAVEEWGAGPRQHRGHDSQTSCDLCCDSRKLSCAHLIPRPRSVLWVRESALFLPDTNPQCSGLNIPARSHVVLQAGPRSGHCLSALSDQWWFIAQQMTAHPVNRLPCLHFHRSWVTSSHWRKMCCLVLLTSVALIVKFWHVTWGKNGPFV